MKERTARIGVALLALLLAISCLICFVPSAVSAAEEEEDYNTARPGVFYVSPDGNDANDGKTMDTAWKSLSFAAYYMGAKGFDEVQTVLVADGVYYEAAEIKPNGVIGAKEQPAVFKSINKWGAKIISTSPYHGVFICNCQYFVFEGFHIDFPEEKNHHFGILINSDNIGVKVSNHVTVRNCIITNAPSSGIQANGSDNILIENNMVFKNALKEDGNNGSGISVYEPKASPSEAEADDNEWGIVIRNNYLWQNNCLHPCPGFSFQTDGNGIIIDDYRWSQNGSKYPYTKETLVENNLIFDNGGRGIHVFISDNVTIRNNTVYKNGWTVMQHNAYGNGINLEQGSGCTVYNNLVISLDEPESTALNDSNKDTVYYNNVVVGTVKINGLNAFPEGSQGNQILGKDKIADVSLYNPSNDLVFLNFSPREGSMLLNAGYTQAGAPADDITGAARDLSDGVTIGAYETGSEAYGIPTDFFDHYQAEGGIVSFRTPSKYTDKVGNPMAEYSAVKIGADTMIASLFEANNEINCKSVSLYLKKVEGKFNVAVYSDNNGELGLKLSETGLQNGVSEEKQYTYDLDKTVSVKEGDKIWIALFVEGGASTEVCAYGVAGAARVAFVDVTDKAPLTVASSLPSDMLLSANLNGTPVQAQTQEKTGCGSSVAASAFAIALPLLAGAVFLSCKKRA